MVFLVFWKYCYVQDQLEMAALLISSIDTANCQKGFRNDDSGANRCILVTFISEDDYQQALVSL